MAHMIIRWWRQSGVPSPAHNQCFYEHPVVLSSICNVSGHIDHVKFAFGHAGVSDPVFRHHTPGNSVQTADGRNTGTAGMWQLRSPETESDTDSSKHPRRQFCLRPRWEILTSLKLNLHLEFNSPYVLLLQLSQVWALNGYTVFGGQKTGLFVQSRAYQTSPKAMDYGSRGKRATRALASATLACALLLRYPAGHASWSSAGWLAVGYG